MSAIVVNDLSISTEMDSVALAEILGGTKTCYINGSWKYLGTKYYFKKWVKKGHKWDRRCQYKLVKDCVII